MGKEKKEIGMLIELANQYEIEKEKSEGVNVDAYVEFKWDYNNNGLVRYDETDHWEGDNLYGDTAVAYLISKKFGMVKWLVENDKIDREKFGNSETKSSKYSDFELSYDTPREDYTNTLLMELAIQNEPIQFLIEMLR